MRYIISYMLVYKYFSKIGYNLRLENVPFIGYESLSISNYLPVDL